MRKTRLVRVCSEMIVTIALMACALYGIKYLLFREHLIGRVSFHLVAFLWYGAGWLTIRIIRRALTNKKHRRVR
jgi:hypothetical protein